MKVSCVRPDFSTPIISGSSSGIHPVYEYKYKRRYSYSLNFSRKFRIIRIDKILEKLENEHIE